ncbi:MAG: trypsin-like serine peptidase [Bacteriovoracia bacterium]
MLRLTMLILLCLSVISCGKESTKSARKKITLTEADMEALMAQQSISCPSQDCPDAIARLFIINFNDAENSSLCTGSLVGPRLLMTNSHCIENGNLQQVCEGFYAVFNSQFGGHEVARCSQVLFRHNHSTNRSGLSSQDYALIQLDRDVMATPLTIERQGFKPGDTVHPYVIDHISGASARIVKLECTVSSDTNNGRDLVLNRCPAIGGNSGAPILLTNGLVGGVLYAAQDTSVNEITELPERQTANTISVGFPMNEILEDLDRWL